MAGGRGSAASAETACVGVEQTATDAGYTGRIFDFFDYRCPRCTLVIKLWNNHNFFTILFILFKWVDLILVNIK